MEERRTAAHRATVTVLRKGEAQVYSTQLSEQEQLFTANVEAKKVGRATVNSLILCEHTPVYTLGKSGEMKNLLIEPSSIGAEFFKTNRGGDITFHGPGQLVVYPILDLDLLGISLAKYIFNLEEVIIRTLRDYNLQGNRIAYAAGVWLRPESSQPDKVCAIGVKASRGITMHGLAMNVNTDLSFFDYIIPCGLEGKGVTSLQRELGVHQDFDAYTQLFCSKFEAVFGVKLVCRK